MEHPRILRIFNIISSLRKPVGCNKHRLAENFQLNVRTIERYFNLIKDIGFPIEKKGERYYINTEKIKTLKYEDGIVFNLEEAALIKACVLNYSGDQPLKGNILNKLYALSELSEINDELYHIKNADFISKIRKAIKEKKQIVLINYHSLNTKSIKKRIVEPIQFIHYFKYLIAYEAKSRMVKQFKTDRIEDARILHKKWVNEVHHQLNQTDIFGMTSDRKQSIKLIMSERAAQLLIEEYPGAVPYVTKKEKGQYEFEHWIAAVEGAGRFVLSLVDEIKIKQPIILQQYVEEKVKKYLSDTICRKEEGALG